MKNSILLIILTILSSTISFSQTLPIGEIPMEHNGSFAGMTDQARFVLNMSGVFGDASGYGLYTSYDKFFKTLRTGVGLTAYNFKYSEFLEEHHLQSIASAEDLYDTVFVDHTYNASYVELAIAPKLSVKGKYTISPSVKIKYGEGYKRLAHNADEIYSTDIQNINITAGLSFNTQRYYLAGAVRLFSRDEIIFRDDRRNDYPSPGVFYSTLEMGYSFPKNRDSKFSFTPKAVFYSVVEENSKYFFRGFDQNLQFRYGNILFGQSTRMANSYAAELITHVGWQSSNFRILLNIWFNDHLTTDVNLRYIIPHKYKKGI